MPGGPGLPWGWAVSPLDPLGLGAPRGVPPAVGFFSLSDVLLVARGTCPARLLAERKRTSSSRPGKGRSGPSGDHARLLQMASRRFPGLHVAGKAYLGLPFPRALVRARPDLLLVGEGSSWPASPGGTGSGPASTGPYPGTPSGRCPSPAAPRPGRSAPGWPGAWRPCRRGGGSRASAAGAAPSATGAPPESSRRPRRGRPSGTP
jgi:hypothetical protein